MTSTNLATVLAEAEALARSVGREDVAAQIGQLRDRRHAAEWMVILLGETSTGKSSWLNTVLGEAVLPATPGATTGLPVQVRWVASDEPCFAAVAGEGSREPLSREEFRHACVAGRPGARSLRLEWPIARRHARIEEADLRGLIVVDAPGYNSCVVQHVEILRDVLPQADAIVAFLNCARGLTPEDVSFLQLIPEFADGATRMTYLVNWVPAGGGAGRLEEMSRKATSQLGGASDLHPLERTSGGHHLQLWNENAWRGLVAVARAPERQARIDHNVANLASLLLDAVGDELADRLRVATMAKEHLDLAERAIEELRVGRARASAILKRAEDDMMGAIARLARSGRDQLWREAEAAIEDAGRFTDAKSCTGWVAGHLLPLHFGRTASAIEEQLEALSERSAEELEGLFLEVEMPAVHGLDDLEVDARVHVDLARRATKGLAGELVRSQLAAFGGRGGANAGFYNLSKKVVSKTGKFFGKTFSKKFYAALPGVLKKIGLTASAASAAAATVAMEATTYLYGVVRWKAKLRGILQHTLGLPAVDEPLEDRILRKIPFGREERPPPFATLEAESRKAVAEAMGKSREVVEKNLARREETLRSALESRRAGSTDVEALRAHEDERLRLTLVLGEWIEEA